MCYFLFLHFLFNLGKHINECEKIPFPLLYLTPVTSRIIGPFLCCDLLYLIIYFVFLKSLKFKSQNNKTFSVLFFTLNDMCKKFDKFSRFQLVRLVKIHKLLLSRNSSISFILFPILGSPTQGQTIQGQTTQGKTTKGQTAQGQTTNGQKCVKG